MDSGGAAFFAHSPHTSTLRRGLCGASDGALISLI
jgi:hypothetical protein